MNPSPKTRKYLQRIGYVIIIVVAIGHFFFGQREISIIVLLVGYALISLSTIGRSFEDEGTDDILEVTDEDILDDSLIEDNWP